MPVVSPATAAAPDLPSEVEFGMPAYMLGQAAGQCLKRVDLSQRLRLLGVRVGKLMRAQDLAAAATPPGTESPDAPDAAPPTTNLDLFPEV